MVTGKGANCLASMLHHYLEHYSRGKTHLVVHADNCVGQNKNNIMMDYLARRVAVGLHNKITMLFLSVGHTKFAPDAGFGILKAKFWRIEVSSVPELAKCIEDSTPVSKLNRAVIVGSEHGEIFVSTYDWQNHLSAMFRPIPQLKQWHSFVFDHRKPGTVTCKLHSKSQEFDFNIGLQCSDIDDAMPSIAMPIPVTPERQWYLYENIRPLVPLHAQDIMCLKPPCARMTYSQVRAVKEGRKDSTYECSKTGNAAVGRSRKSKQPDPDAHQKSESKNAVLPPPKRRKATCSYCHETGHINKVVRNVPPCPKRRNAETIE